ncbi:MAG: hypothetical protein HYX51_03110 [Chloroflexi bacterium]|nr:hypothetical protein [Chloroflexota bacterium]
MRNAAEALAEYERQITDLDQALRDAAAARQALELDGDQLSYIEAETTLHVDGRNEAERRAKLVIELQENPDYQAALASRRTNRERLADADRRVTIATERCRMLRGALAVGSGGEG